MFPKPSEEAVGKLRRADREAAEERRARWEREFMEGPPPTFDRDCQGINPAFLAWLAKQGTEIRDDLVAYWDSDCKTAAGVSHASPRGQHARMTMVIAYATERHGYAR